MTTFAALLVLLFAAGLLAGVVLLLDPVPADPDPVVVVAPYRGDYPQDMGQPTALPRRPEGRQALKAEIRASENVVEELPPPRWAAWESKEYKAAWADFFDGLPDDQAVHREWVGAGHVGS